jgi:uncharacterized membrane protein HdeD (DUF308 family)
MLNLISRNWWLVALRGVVAIIFGILALVWPGPALLTLVFFFGIYALLDGIFAISETISGNTGGRPRWLVLLEGVVSLIAGILTFVWPSLTALVLLYVIALWALITGITEIVAAIELRRRLQGEWVLILSGVASIIFGILLLLFPGAGALALIWVIGIYAIVFGILLLGLALRLRALHTQTSYPDSRLP